MTECSQFSFEFQRHFHRGVTVRFDGGKITSDAGGLLLRETDRRIGLIKRFAACFEDRRRADRVEHPVAQLVAQRVYAVALGYEDLNDHDHLRHDPVLAVLAGREDVEGRHRRRAADRGHALAGKSTLNRLELTPAEQDEQQRYKKIRYDAAAVDSLLVNLFLEAYPQPPAEIVLDLDTTDTPLHGHQEGRFFHGFYDEYCYLPLYVFCGEMLLGVRLREANTDASAGCLEEVARIVRQIRQRWPEVRIILRADSGFCRDALMSWCEAEQVDYVFGFARNVRLRRLIEPQMEQAARQYTATGRAARVFTEFEYETNDSWSRARRVIAKAEHLGGKENPRFVVTSLDAGAWPAQALYESLYCARGDMENRIKEQFSLFSDRMSTATMRANQLRLYFSAMAYALVQGLRRIGLRGTEWAQAQVATIRTHLLKVGARVKVSVRRIWISLAESFPHKAAFKRIYAAMRC